MKSNMEAIDLDKFYLTARQHASDPYNLGAIDDFNGNAKITGPCGDTMEFWLDVQNGKIQKISFITDGCDPSLASGSMATCLVEGKSLAEAKAVSRQDILKSLGGLPKDFENCALLAPTTL